MTDNTRINRAQSSHRLFCAVFLTRKQDNLYIMLFSVERKKVNFYVTSKSGYNLLIEKQVL